MEGIAKEVGEVVANKHCFQLDVVEIDQNYHRRFDWQLVFGQLSWHGCHIVWVVLRQVSKWQDLYFRQVGSKWAGSWVGQDVSPIARPLALSALPQDNDVCVKSFTTLLSPTTGPLGRDPCARWDTPGVSCQVVCVHLHNLRSHSIQRAAPSESAWSVAENARLMTRDWEWCWIVGTCDLHLVPSEVTTLRNVVGAGAEKIVWVCRPSAQWHTFAILCILMMLKNLLPTTRIGRFCLLAM